MVVDADDWVNSESFCDCLVFLKDCDADLVLFDKITCFENEKKNSWCEIIKGDFAFNQTLPIANAAPVLWDFSIHHMIVKNAILHNSDICLDHGFYTDIELIWFLLPHIETVVVTDRCIKIYRRREGQSTTPLNCYNHRMDFEIVLRRLAVSLAQIRTYNLAPDHMQFIERKMVAVIHLYFTWMLNVPFIANTGGLSHELRAVYYFLKPEINRIKNPDFGFFVNTLIKCNFRWFFMLGFVRKTYLALPGLFYSSVASILPKGTKRRRVVKQWYRKIKILLKKI
jgi:hypothetical protein